MIEFENKYPDSDCLENLQIKTQFLAVTNEALSTQLGIATEELQDQIREGKERQPRFFVQTDQKQFRESEIIEFNQDDIGQPNSARHQREQITEKIKEYHKIKMGLGSKSPERLDVPAKIDVRKFKNKMAKVLNDYQKQKLFEPQLKQIEGKNKRNEYLSPNALNDQNIEQDQMFTLRSERNKNTNNYESQLQQIKIKSSQYVIKLFQSAIENELKKPAFHWCSKVPTESSFISRIPPNRMSVIQLFLFQEHKLKDQKLLEFKKRYELLKQRLQPPKSLGPKKTTTFINQDLSNQRSKTVKTKKSKSVKKDKQSTNMTKNQLKDQLQGVANKTQSVPNKMDTNAVFNFDIPPYNAGFTGKSNWQGGNGEGGNNQDNEINMQDISYKKLQKMIIKNYPVDPYSKQSFSIRDRITVKDYWSKVTDFFRFYQFRLLFDKCIKYQKKNQNKSIESIKKNIVEKPKSLEEFPTSNSDSSEEAGDGGLTDASLNIGHGALLYLQTMKTFAIMFGILSLINLPVYLICSRNTENNDLNNFENLFVYWSVGNLGRPDYYCGQSEISLDLKQDPPDSSQIELKCKGSNFISTVDHLGFLYAYNKQTLDKTSAVQVCNKINFPDKRIKKKNNNTTVLSVEQPTIEWKDFNQTQYNIDSECNLNNMWAQKQQTLEKQEEMDEQIKDSFFDPDKLKQFEKDMAKEIEKEKTSYFDQFLEHFAQNCINQKNCTVDTSQFHLMISDKCKDRMKQQNRITSTEFVLIISCQSSDVKAPIIETYLNKEYIGIFIVFTNFVSIVFMAHIFQTITKINDEFLEIVDNLMVQMKDFSLKLDDVKIDKSSQARPIIKMKVWLHFMELLKPLKTCDNIMEIVDVTLSLFSDEETQIILKMQKLQWSVNKIKENIFARLYTDDEIEMKKGEMDNLLKKLTQLKAKYLELTKCFTYDEKSAILPDVFSKKNKKQKRLRSLQYIFITFKHCESCQQVLEYIKDSKTFSKVILDKLTGCCKKKGKEQEKELFKLFGEPLIASELIEPDEILWENFPHDNKNQNLRRLQMILLSLAFLVIVVILTIYLVIGQDYLENKIPLIQCQDLSITREAAYIDELSKSPTGIMQCYCYDYFQQHGHYFGVDFQDLDPKNKDSTNYCIFWQFKFFLKFIYNFFADSSAVFVNGIISVIFQKLSKYQKKHTKVEESVSSFQLIFSMEFATMALIILLQSFDGMGIQDFLLGIKDPKDAHRVYRGFESDWYVKWGKKIGYLIMIASFSSNIWDIGNFAIVFFKRCKDRNYKLNLKKDPEDPDDDQPNSRIKIQSELENLYISKEFDGEKAYSRMMSILFFIILYSSGLPSLYVVGFIFYTVTYCVNKLLIFKYYTKSRTLTRTIPLYSQSFFFYGFLVHFVCGIFMMTNPFIIQTKSKHSHTDIGSLKNSIQSLKAAGIDLVEQAHDNADKSSLKFIWQRIDGLHQIVYIIYAGTLFIIYFFGAQTKMILKQTISAFIKAYEMIKSWWNNTREHEHQNLCDGDPKKLKAQKQFQTSILKMVSLKLKKQVSDHGHNHHGHPPLEEQAKIKRQLSKRALTKLKKQMSVEYDLNLSADEENIDQLLNHSIQNQAIQQMNIKRKQQQEEEDLKERKKLLLKSQDRPDYSENIYMEFSPENLGKFYERSIRELQDFRRIFYWNKEIGYEIFSPDSKHPMRTIFKEVCYINRITQDEVVKYQFILMKRICDIEDTIDHHFDLIRDIITEAFKKQVREEREKKQAREGKAALNLQQQLAVEIEEQQYFETCKELQFDDEKLCTYQIKMEWLEKFQDQLIQVDKQRPNNRRGIQEICRMSGSLTQSYFIYDAQQYSIGRKFFFGLDKDRLKNNGKL